MSKCFEGGRAKPHVRVRELEEAHVLELPKLGNKRGAAEVVARKVEPAEMAEGEEAAFGAYNTTSPEAAAAEVEADDMPRNCVACDSAPRATIRALVPRACLCMCSIRIIQVPTKIMGIDRERGLNELEQSRALIGTTLRYHRWKTTLRIEKKNEEQR